MGVIEELLVRIVGDNSDLKAALADSEKAVQGTAKTIEQGLKAANKAALVVGAAVVTLGGLAIHAAADFESAFAGVVQNVNDSEEALAGLKQGIRDMAKATGFAATDLAKVASAAGELGLAAAPAKEFTQTVADFARATGSSLDEATAALTDYVRQANVAPEQVRGLTSVTIALTNKLGGQEEGLLAVAASLDATTSAAGLSKVQTLALAGALNSMGVDAGRGSQAIKGLLVNMGAAVQKGGKDLEGFAQVAGVTTDDFAKQFRTDAAGALATFLKGLHDVKAGGGDTLQALNALGLADGQVRDTLLKAAEGADRFTVAMATAATEAGDQTALAHDAAIANETAAVKMERLKAEVNDLAIGVGAALLPAFEGLLGIIKPVVGWLGQHEKVAAALLISLGAMAALVIGVNAALKVYAAVQAIIKAATVAWTVVQWALNVAMDANPIGLLILAIGALVAAIVFVIAKWDEILAGMKIVGDWIVGVFIGIWNSLVSFFTGLWDGVKAVFQAAWDFILAIMLAPIEAAMAAWSAISDFFVGLWDGIKAFFSGLVDWFVNIGKNIVDGFLNGLKGAWDNVTGWVGDAVDGVKDFFTSGFGIFSPSKVFAGYGDNIVQGLAQGMQGMEDAMVKPIEAAKDAAQVSMEATANVVTTGAAQAGAAAMAASQPPAPPSAAPTTQNTTSVTFAEGAIQVIVGPGAGSGIDLKGIGQAVRAEIADLLRSVGVA